MPENRTAKAQPPSTTGLLAEQCVKDSEDWFGDTGVHTSVPHMTLALAGEVGELANIVKKIERGSIRLEDARTRYDLAMEMTDVYIYLLNLAGLLHVDLEHAYKVKRRQNIERFTLQRAERQAKRQDG